MSKGILPPYSRSAWSPEIFQPLIDHWESLGKLKVCSALVVLEKAFLKYHQFSSVKDFENAEPFQQPMLVAEAKVRELMETVQ